MTPLLSFWASDLWGGIRCIQRVDHCKQAKKKNAKKEGREEREGEGREKEAQILEVFAIMNVSSSK